jgi:hypothetical protein
MGGELNERMKLTHDAARNRAFANRETALMGDMKRQIEQGNRARWK